MHPSRRPVTLRAIVLSILVSVVLAACGGGGASELGPADQGTSPPQATQPEPGGNPPSAGGDIPRGGTLTIAYKDDLATLDPAVGYDWTNWPAEKMVFDGLLDYDDTTNLQPRLAESMPEVSLDATVYTFRLRQGVTFHNGREVTADDVAYSITRVLDPQTKSPGSGFYTGIAGAQDFIDGKADSVSGIRVVDPRTIEFTLESPDVTFGNKMALNFAFIVPKEEVERLGENFGHNPVGTGPFLFREWIAGRQLTFERNPNYFFEGLPYLDQVVIQVGVEPEVALLRLERGEIDSMGDPIPAAEFARIKDDDAWQGRLTSAPQVSTIYITMNTQMKPFDNVQVRRAMNMAIDKERIIRLLGGRGTVANQILPPLMPGYDQDYQGYEYNPDQARQLLADAGYPNGFSTTMECIAVEPQPKLCESFQQDLSKIGVQVQVQTLAASTVIADGGTEGKVPLVWSGGLGWIQDYPDPDDFYTPILSCVAAVPGGWNWPWYCNQDLEQKAQQAIGTTDTEQRLGLYREIYRTLMDEAVWIPVYNGQYDIAHSDKLVGKETDFAHPEHTIRYERLAKQP
ncbi:ABC transporter substrate-binding protein [Sphaerobacter sp.]|uniref:ABC transporter substrate-binding protein n=1 Tax=Sphaerobacter sp. TaxID=2099654 RepID=UPI001D797A24|nr:ABC transporter substrate-binding protein [Sphaerobacter sp.]MBX5443906.1 ABC transporter substrate-binding protein [Sphaerobacter sp.]